MVPTNEQATYLSRMSNQGYPLCPLFFDALKNYGNGDGDFIQFMDRWWKRDAPLPLKLGPEASVHPGVPKKGH